MFIYIPYFMRIQCNNQFDASVRIDTLRCHQMWLENSRTKRRFRAGNVTKLNHGILLDFQSHHHTILSLWIQTPEKVLFRPCLKHLLRRCSWIHWVSYPREYKYCWPQWLGWSVGLEINRVISMTSTILMYSALKTKKQVQWNHC